MSAATPQSVARLYMTCRWKSERGLSRLSSRLVCREPRRMPVLGIITMASCLIGGVQVGRRNSSQPGKADKAYFLFFRFYGPRPPLFVKTWKRPDLEQGQ
jgi:hypothetical protein